MTEQKIAPVLTLEEVFSLIGKHLWLDKEIQQIEGDSALVRAVEQAVLARVGAVRDQALEEAAHQLWLMRARPEFEPDESDRLLDRAMASIRALKGTPAAAVADAPPAAYLRASDLERLAKPHVAGCAASLEKEPCAGFVPIYLAPQLSANPGQVADAQPVAWDNFPAYLIDKHEGDTITEEGLQRALAGMLADPQYAATQPSGNPGQVADIEDLIDRLLDAQQDINLAANETMSQPLCSASALIDEIEQVLRSVAAQPGAQAQPSGNAVHLADDTRVGILADSSYVNGMRTGYLLGQAGNEAEFQKIITATRAQISEARAEVMAQPSTNPGLLAAVEQDAERYRYLRAQSPVENFACERRIEVKVSDWLHNLGAVHGPNMWGHAELSGIELDEAIDAAIAASKEGASHG